MIVATFKQLVSSLKNNFFVFILSFVILPVAFAIILSNTQKGMFSGKVEVHSSKIEIEDNDNSKYSKVFKNIFETEEMEKYFEISKEADYKITIPKNFEKELLNSKVNLKVETLTKKATVYELEYTKEFLKSVGDSLLVSVKNNNVINSIDDEELANEVKVNLEKIQSQIIVANEQIEPKNKMTSDIYTAITYMQFIFINYLMTMAVGAKKLSETTALEMRVDMFPVKKVKLNIVSALMNSLLIFVFSLIYMAIMNLLGMAFLNNILIYVLATLIICLTVGFISLLLGCVKKEISIVIMYLILGVQMILGGMIGPVDKVFGGTFLESLSNLNFNAIFSKPLMDVFNNTINIKTFIPHIVVTIVCIIISTIIIKINEKKKVGA